MVPAHPAAEWRQTFSTCRPIARPPEKSEPSSYRARQQRHQGHPPHDLIPRPVTLTQRREIDPVNNRTAPIPRAFYKTRALQNLPGARRDIQIGSSGIVQPYAIKRPVGIKALVDNPLVV